MNLKGTLALLFATLLPGCGQGIADPALVDSLRVLGVRADPPEASPGESVALDALVTDPAGAGRALVLAWSLCVPDPVIGVASCADAARNVPFAAGSSASLAIPVGALDPVPESMREGGIVLFVVLTVDAGDETVQAVKSVRVSTSAAANANPSISCFEVGGDATGPGTVASGVPLSLRACARSGSAERVMPAGSGIEALEFRWFVTSGTLAAGSSSADLAGTAETAWTPGDPAATVWVVLRDGRGGVDWSERRIGATLRTSDPRGP